MKCAIYLFLKFCAKHKKVHMAHEKVVLLKPPSLCVEDDRLEAPLGILYIASVARQRGYDVSVFDMSGCTNEKEINERIDQIPQADAYGLSIFCTNHDYSKLSIESIRKKLPKALVIAGGPNPSALPEYTLSDTGADVVITGEAEDAFADCLDRYFLDGKSVRGIIGGKGRVDLDSYLFPAFDLVDMSTYSRKVLGEPSISLISSRGCANSCAHCNSIIMGGGSRGTRYRSAENLYEEMNGLLGNYSKFRFNDDNFTGNPEMKSLSRKIKDLGVKIRVFGRCEELSPENYRYMEDMGIFHVSTGLESLNPENLKIIGKSKQIGKEGNIRTAKDHGISVRAYFIVGLPYDNDKNIVHYFEKASHLGLDEFTIYPLIPYPGSRIARNPERFGYEITDNDFRNYIQIGVGGKTCYALRHKNFGPEDVQRWKKTAENILTGGGAIHTKNSGIAR